LVIFPSKRNRRWSTFLSWLFDSSICAKLCCIGRYCGHSIAIDEDGYILVYSVYCVVMDGVADDSFLCIFDTTWFTKECKKM